MADNPTQQPGTRLFLSYGRRDAAALANRLRQDLEKLGYEVWQDTRRIRAGKEWELEIQDGLRSTQVVIALLSPHAVRRSTDPNSPDNVDSVCLDELTFARFASPPTPIVPVMAIPCEPAFPVFRLDYVEMTKWADSDDEYRRGFERLVEGIGAAIRGESLPFRRWHHCLPVLDFAPQLHEKRQDFVGRQWLFDEIDGWRASSGRERALLIIGDPGIGKSAFVAEMIHRNPGGQVLAYHICRADDPETLRPSTFIMSLTGMIAGRIPAFADLLEAPQFHDLFDPKTVSGRPTHVLDQGLIAGLHRLRAPDDGIRYLLIDALDEALTLGERQLNIVTLLSSRLDQLPSWLRVVATTRREPDVLNRLSTLRASMIDAHRQDNLDDIDRFIEGRLQSPNLAERLAASRVPLATVQQKLRQKADGNFLYVSQALQDIERDNYSFSCLDELPQGLTQWYEAWFTRKFPNPKMDFVDARKVLEVVLAAREPLTIEQLKDMTLLEPHYVLPEALVDLSPIIANSNLRFSVFHKSLADWLSSSTRAYRISIPLGHIRIAGLMDRWEDLEPHTKEYLATFFPAHASAGEKWSLIASEFQRLGRDHRLTLGRGFDSSCGISYRVEVVANEKACEVLLETLISAPERAFKEHLREIPELLFRFGYNCIIHSGRSVAGTLAVWAACRVIASLIGKRTCMEDQPQAFLKSVWSSGFVGFARFAGKTDFMCPESHQLVDKCADMLNGLLEQVHARGWGADLDPI